MKKEKSRKKIKNRCPVLDQSPNLLSFYESRGQNFSEVSCESIHRFLKQINKQSNTPAFVKTEIIIASNIFRKPEICPQYLNDILFCKRRKDEREN